MARACARMCLSTERDKGGSSLWSARRASAMQCNSPSRGKRCLVRHRIRHSKEGVSAVNPKLPHKIVHNSSPGSRPARTRPAKKRFQD
ncbi:hypothetical protein NDU88_004939 [Pleurodeles waltl]|uniref:Uncharacterized protein n=1 Tax=Pleurodeles waltl TaxID=8319 RepID=A0AAV7PGD1_PLEWA|nr:hypothetical protein NDU88_004939 [Pleurodeles waltl]